VGYLDSAAIVSIKMVFMKEKASVSFGFMKRNRHGFSNRKVHLHTGGYLFVISWMHRFQNDGLGGTVQHHDHHVHRTLPLWTFFVMGVC
jgi:hypothetical protein